MFYNNYNLLTQKYNKTFHQYLAQTVLHSKVHKVMVTVFGIGFGTTYLRTVKLIVFKFVNNLFKAVVFVVTCVLKRVNQNKNDKNNFCYYVI